MEEAYLEKAEKGTPQYEEWLRKYRLKVHKQEKNDTVNRKRKDGTTRNLFAGKVIRESIASAGPAAEIITNVLAGSVGSDGEGNSHEGLVRQISSLFTECKDYDFTISTLEDNYVRALDMEGAESKLYLSPEDDFIIKVQDWAVNSKSPLEYLTDRVILHNTLFPNTAYELFGFGLDDTDEDKLKFILTQPFICGRSATNEEISKYMTSLGFEQQGSNWVYGSYIISDLNRRNVLVDDNNVIYVIDEVISIKR